ncbi:PAM68 family protein [Leptolyngbya ohadii]|uniref:PAM68 family protein n=1 Tax=Leptolyngbya ohadii TaxID=1962290 RepID=UPI000B59E0C2|nr:PAM68 family protein [Leptolyngbya ohadii]
MSSKPQPDSSNSSSKDGSESRQSLPFEPKKSRKQVEKSPAKTPIAPAKVEKKADKSTAAKPTSSRVDRGTTVQQTAIPDVVSRRMIKRMALLCGIPSALGMSTFIVSYLLVVNDLFKVPTYAVLLVSLGWFGLGVLGLSYGVLSASWDEETAGSLVGWSEFTTNFGRMTSAWRSSKDASKNKT